MSRGVQNRRNWAPLRGRIQCVFLIVAGFFGPGRVHVQGDETQALAKAVAGDPGALTRLLERYGPQVRAGLRISNRWQSIIDPDDVMQITYLEAFMRIGTFTGPSGGAFAGWLDRIAQNNLRDAIRAQERDKRPPVDKRVQPATREESAIAFIEQLGVSSTTPSRHAGAAEARQKLEAAIELLPDDYSAAVRLYDLEGRGIEETAREMGRSPGAVHMLRARAHDRLRELLGPESDILGTSA